MQWKWKACCEAVSFASSPEEFGMIVSYIADPPGDGAFLASGTCLVGLAVDAQIHDVVAADGAVVDDDVPCPQRDGVPL